eukprot:2027360-Amphidinium_carterae.2
MAIRRTDEACVRVPYLPSTSLVEPVCLVLDVESSRDFRDAVSQVGREMVACWHLSFDLTGYTPADADPDTTRGKSVRLLLSNCAKHVNRKWELAAVPVSIFLHDVGQLVLLARPSYFLSVTSAAVDAQIIVNDFLTEQQLLEQHPSELIAVVSAERSVAFVQGGGPAYLPVLSEDDDLMVCVRAVLARSGKCFTTCDAECAALLRTVAQHWLRNAYKQHWLCAGHYLDWHAARYSTSPQEFLDRVCDPSLRFTPHAVLVDALAAFYSVNMYVINDEGSRIDGFVRCSGYGLQCLQSRWRVLDHFDRLMAVPFAPVSPTEPFIEPSEPSPPTSVPFRQGAGKVCHVHQNAVAHSVCEALTMDLTAAQCSLVNADLLKHVVLHDKRCCLACFQARTAAQRLCAFAAALRRMGLPDAAAAVHTASTFDTRHAVPPIDPAASVSAPVLPPPTAQAAIASPSQVNDALMQRVSSLEIWAHSWDAAQLDDSESGAAAVRAHELLSVMARQAITDQGLEWRDACSAEVDALRSLVHSQAEVLSRADLQFEQLNLTVAALRARIEQAESASLPSNPTDSTRADSAQSGTSQPTLSAHFSSLLPQMQQLLKMHTEAIGHTWQWTSSILLALMQQRSTNLQMHQMLVRHDELFVSWSSALSLPTATSGVQQQHSNPAVSPECGESAERVVDSLSHDAPPPPEDVHGPIAGASDAGDEQTTSRPQDQLPGAVPGAALLAACAVPLLVPSDSEEDERHSDTAGELSAVE